MSHHEIDSDLISAGIEDFEDKLFDFICDAKKRVSIDKFKAILNSAGLRNNDPRLKETMANFRKVEIKQLHDEHELRGMVERDVFHECVADNIVLISKAMKNQFVIPEWVTFTEHIDEIYDICAECKKGTPAGYIPQLARVNPDYWGVAVCTIDGQRHSRGDTKVAFSLQSTVKPLSYSLVLNDLTPDIVHKYVGQEPSGRSFNELTLDYQNKPHNPMINAGAIVISSLLKKELNVADRFDYAMAQLRKLAGGEYVAFNNAVSDDTATKSDGIFERHWVDRQGSVDSKAGMKLPCKCSNEKPHFSLTKELDGNQSVTNKSTKQEKNKKHGQNYLSERHTADRNFALGYYMRENKCFPDGVDLHEVLEFYFQLCSIEVTAESGAVMAATLANGGICPMTGEKVLSPVAVRNTLSLMHSCGMYDYSGQFAFTVGLPAKSGVAGGIMLVVPNVMGIFLWSPPLDIWGNSCKGVLFCQELVNRFSFHNYDNIKHSPNKIDPRGRTVESRAQDVVSLLFSAYNGDVSAMRRYALLGMDMSQADYDGRTALHLAAAEGHLAVVKFLLDKCNVSPYVVDRWGFTPYDDAKRFGHAEVADVLQTCISEQSGKETFDLNRQMKNLSTD